MFKVILSWVQQHIVVTIVIGVVVVGGVVATPVILLNVKDESKPNVETKVDDKQNQEQEPEESQEPELNEDGCPVGSFLNYYGICQDERLYEPQECQEGYEWVPDAHPADAYIENSDGTISPDYNKIYGIDGLPVGACRETYETYCASLAQTPGAAPCSTTKYGLEEKESFENRTKCERGFTYDSETDTCVDRRYYHRAVYEYKVLGDDSGIKKYGIIFR